MRLYALIFPLFISSFFPIFSQSEGWSSTCGNILPSVVEVMLDACGDDNEFFREYVVIQSGTQPFNIQDYNLRVTNPFNNAFIGSVKVEKGYSNPKVIDKLNAANTGCGYPISFRDVFSEPYFGIVPPKSKVLIFNNKDSVDLSFLGTKDFSNLCGSKVFVALGTVRPQSPNTPIFRNFPRNRNCGTTGCLRKLEFQYQGTVTPACQQMTYDILKLPSPAVIRPNEEFGDGSYIRPIGNGIVGYGGGGPNGTSTVCMPEQSLNCTIPAQPEYGNGFWNVSVFDGANNFTNFKGFYQAKGNHTASIQALSGSFEYNTGRDGWKPYQSPSEAHPTFGALTAYDGCDVKSDSFSLIAKRKGFICGDYSLKLLNYDDFCRIRIDANGDGTWELDNTFNAPACSNGCNTSIWQGTLGVDSRMEIWSYDIRKEFNTTLVFEKINAAKTPIKITATSIPTSACNSTNGSINLNITGGNAPYATTWTGTTAIPTNAINGSNLASGLYKVIVKDGSGCADSTQILVPQSNPITVQAGNDTAYCAGGSAILRGAASGGSGALNYEWLTSNGSVSTNATTSVSPSISTSYILKVTDANGCFKTDTVVVTIRDLPYLTLKMSTKDTICNNDVSSFKSAGANTYIWSTFPQIAGTALSSRTGDSVALFALFLPAPQYRIIAEGTGINGCKNTIETTIVINPLPNVTIDPIADTLCVDGALRTLTGTPMTGGRFLAVNQLTGAACPTCIVNDNQFNASNAGIGKFTISHELRDNIGCRNAPSIEINVKRCNTCTKTDSTLLTSFTCDITKVGRSSQLFQNKSGCDSVVVTLLILSPLDSTKINLTTCDSTKQGVDIKNLKNSYNCDSVVVTTTRWLRTGGDTTKITAKTCDPIQVGTTSLQTLRKVSGCDSIVQTTLVLNRRDVINLNATICPSDSFNFDNKWLKTSGLYNAVLKNTEGCDSTVTLNLTTLRADTTLITKKSCNLINVGQSEIKLKNSRGCDSVIIAWTVYEASPASIDIRTTKTITCSGKNDGELSLRIRNGNNPPYYWRWMTGDTNTILRNVRAGRYSVTATDSEGCQIRDTITLSEPTPLSILSNGIAPKCFENPNGSLLINNIAGGAGTYRLESNIITKKLDTLPHILNNIPVGKFKFTILDKNNCPFDTTVDINQGRKLLISLNNTATINLGESHVLDAVVSNDIQSVKWTPPTGLKCDSCLSTVATPTTSTNYTLNVTDTDGCKATSIVSLAVDKKRRVFAPTTFSPNNDGVNDIFTLYTDSSVKFISNLRIFNRWGALMFTSEKFTSGDITSGWDGTFKGKELPSDVFVFFAEIEFKDGRKELIQGDVTLVR